jgi:hypothetical protein
MSWAIDYRSETQLVAVVVAGEISDDELKAKLEKIIEALERHSANLVLVDCADALSQATLPALYYLPEHATACGAPWHLRIAVVLPKTGYRVDTFQFLRLVFRSAGYDMHLFKDVPAAEEWLLHRPPVEVAINHAAGAR